MSLLIKSLIVGYGILIIAIMLNFLAMKFETKTWNEFLTKDAKLHGFNAFNSLSFLDTIFLFFLYPLMLGAIAYTLFKIISK